MTTKTLSLVAATLLLTCNALAEETLQDITVTTANKTAQSIQNTTSNVSVITAEDIEENGYQSVAEAISHTAGISITNNGGLGKVTSIFLRGMKTEKILVLLDGVILNNPSSTDGQAFFEHISLDNIEQIEIIKGGTSSIWGTDASAGVINIITKGVHKEGVKGSLNLSYDSYSTKKAVANLSYKQNNLDLVLNASKLKSKGFSAKLPRDAEADGYDNKSANIKLGYRFNTNNKILLNYNYVDTNAQYDGLFSALGANDPVANINTKQKDFIFAYTFSDENYYSKLQYIHSTSNRLDTSDSSYGDALVTYDASIKEFSWINKYQYTAQGSLLVGAEVKKTKGTYQFNSFTPTQNEFNDKAVYLAINHTFDGFSAGKTLIEASIRKDIFDKFKNQFSYKVGLKHFHAAIDGLTSSMNYYKSTDAPNSYQVANTLAGKTLTPDTTKGFDISLNYKEIGITYFSNTITNKIAYDFASYGYTNNQGKEKVKGIELTASHAFNSIVLTSNYTHLITFKDESGVNLSKRAKDTLNVSLDHYTDNNTHIGVDAQYIGDRKEFGQDTGNYTLWNLNFGTKVMDGIDVSIHAKNIFDKEYETTAGYATQGRSIYMNLKYTF